KARHDLTQGHVKEKQTEEDFLIKNVAAMKKQETKNGKEVKRKGTITKVTKKKRNPVLAPVKRMIEPYTTQQLFDQPADITVGQLLAMNPKLRMAVNKNLRKSIVKKKDETTKKRTTVNEKKGENEATEIEDLMAINISKPSNDKSSTLYCEASIKHIKFLLIVDSGSARSIMSLVLLKDLQMEITRASKTVMVNVNGKQRRPLGAVSAIPLNIMGRIIPMDAIVTDADSYAAIVGNDWLRKTKANIDYGTNKLTLKWEDEILRIPTEYVEEETVEEEADEAIEESEEEYETDNDEKQQEQLYCNTQFITRERAQEIEQDLKENKLIENECYYQYKEVEKGTFHVGDLNDEQR
ncbi:hypothetical protein RclHR1_37480001, partial [Rhizophagus clarus]